MEEQRREREQIAQAKRDHTLMKQQEAKAKSEQEL